MNFPLCFWNWFLIKWLHFLQEFEGRGSGSMHDESLSDEDDAKVYPEMSFSSHDRKFSKSSDCCHNSSKISVATKADRRSDESKLAYGGRMNHKFVWIISNLNPLVEISYPFPCYHLSVLSSYRQYVCFKSWTLSLETCKIKLLLVVYVAHEHRIRPKSRSFDMNYKVQILKPWILFSLAKNNQDQFLHLDYH